MNRWGKIASVLGVTAVLAGAAALAQSFSTGRGACRLTVFYAAGSSAREYDSVR